MANANEIIARFNFALPNDYLLFLKAGVLINDVTAGIRVSRHFWMLPKEIQDCSWPNYKIASLVPCARTPGNDHYCWSTTDGQESAWIAECPRDSDFAEGFAPHFEGFVFRSVLEELGDTWLTTDVREAASLFETCIHRASVGLRPQWTQILMRYASKSVTLNQWGRPHVIPAQELLNVIKSELAFTMLGEEFRQHSD